MKLVFPGSDIRLVLRCLRKLEKEKLIERLTRDDRLRWVWSLGRKGRGIYGWSRKLRVNKNNLTHDLLTNDVRFKLEELKCAKRFESSFRIREKVSSNVSPRDRGLDQIPDWICAIDFNTNIKVCALEVELNYKGKRRMEKVFETYSYKESIDRIIYFVPNDSMVKKILDHANDHIEEKGSKWVLVINVFDLLNNGTESKVHYLGGKLSVKKVFSVHRSVHTVGTENTKKAA